MNPGESVFMDDDNFSSSAQSAPVVKDDTSVMQLKDWIITLVIMVIPCVNIVMTFVWAFGAGNLNRKNWARAILVFWAAGIVLWLIFAATIGGILSTIIGSMGN